MSALIVSLIATLLVAAAILHGSVTRALSQSNHAAEATNRQFTRHVGLGDVKCGALLFRAIEEGKFVEAPRLATDVSIDVTGPIA
ncbi:MAG: hypothetical protein K8F25_19575, partial [Fimbriimonadaceae bacterium]|nr:hypothetical protein [Alphaproteobacteria bacterium]